MSFNLNKNDEAAASKKTSFDLSKSEAEVPVKRDGKPMYWLYALVALVLIAGAAWYWNSKQTSSVPTQTAAAPAKSDPADTAGRTSAERVTEAAAPVVSDDPAAADTAQAAVEPGDTVPVIAASFDAGAIQPKKGLKSALAMIREQVKNDPGLSINVVGYASSEGDLAVNQAIAQARADAYKKFLVRKGIRAEKITAQGKGIENPIATNDTEAGRRKNRRVEVQIKH